MSLKKDVKNVKLIELNILLMESIYVNIAGGKMEDLKEKFSHEPNPKGIGLVSDDLQRKS